MLCAVNLGAKSLQGDEPAHASPQLTAAAGGKVSTHHCSSPEMVQEAERGSNLFFRSKLELVMPKLSPNL